MHCSQQFNRSDHTNNVTIIGKGAFSYNILTHVTIQNGVTTIDGGAFMFNQLETVTIRTA